MSVDVPYRESSVIRTVIRQYASGSRETRLSSVRRETWTAEGVDRGGKVKGDSP
jgi:hypothetical protein